MQYSSDCTLFEQLLWATQMEGFYGSKMRTLEHFVASYVSSGIWQASLGSAKEAVEGYSTGPTTDSWFWGNVSKEEKGY
jgi:hypothetical protein